MQIHPFIDADRFDMINGEIIAFHGDSGGFQHTLIGRPTNGLIGQILVAEGNALLRFDRPILNKHLRFLEDGETVPLGTHRALLCTEEIRSGTIRRFALIIGRPPRTHTATVIRAARVFAAMMDQPVDRLVVWDSAIFDGKTKGKPDGGPARQGAPRREIRRQVNGTRRTGSAPASS